MIGANHGIGRERPPNALRALRVAALVCVLAMAWFAFRPSASVPDGLPWDKANHFAGFLVLTMVTACAWPRRPRYVLSAFLIAWGVIIELVQGTDFIGRDADVRDVVADAVGVGAGLLAVMIGGLRARAARL